MLVDYDGNWSADEGSFRSDRIVPWTEIFSPTTPSQVSATKEDFPSIVVFGSVAIDLSCDFSPRDKYNHPSLSPQMHTSNIAAITPSIGGVGHNVALAAQLAGGDTSVRLCSYVADDL
jgi:pseudouridine-5'-phosphate glycosidase/pseudouridine kinase